MPEQLVLDQLPPKPGTVAPPPAAPSPEGESAQTPAAPEAATPPGSEKPTTPDPAAEKRSQSRFERRIDRLHRRAAEEKARADHLEKRIAELQPATPPDPSAPRLEQFDYDPEKYATAKAEHEKKKTLQEYEAKQREASAKQVNETLMADWEDKAARADDKYEDFSSVVGDLKPTSPLAVAIIGADNAEDVAYYLGKHMKEAQRLASLPPIQAVREIGKLEAKLLADPPVKPKTPSKAPAPISALSGTSTPSSAEIRDGDSYEEFLKKRNRQLKRK